MRYKETWQGKHGPLLIAEIGGNHEGDFDYCLELTKLAIEADVDYIKYQMYSGDTLVSQVENPVRNKHFKKFELRKEQYIQLAGICQDAGKNFMASVWNPEYFEWINEFMPVYKIGSGDMTAYPVIKATAELGKPIIISTGLSSIDEVLHCVSYIQSLDDKYKHQDYLSILQCTSMYPIPYEDANLNVMASYKKLTGLPVGYSDHTEGSKALEIAVAMGAEILEFHFTDSREGKTFRDHKVSLTKDEVHDLIEAIKDIHRLQGSASKIPLPVEGDHVRTFRRAVYPKHDIPKGTKISEDMLICLRPNEGIDAREFGMIPGKICNKKLEKHARLSWSDFN